MQLGSIDNKEKNIMNLNNEVSDDIEQEARTGGEINYRDVNADLVIDDN